MAELQLKDIRKSFGAVDVIKGVSLEVKSGEFMVFVGPSGCGKSTLLRLVAGLEDITSGTLEFDGQVVNGLTPSKRGIAMVFQSYALYPHMTVYDNMAFGMQLNGGSKDAIKKRVEAAAELLQITPYLERLPKQLSGGQRQRVAIGRAIVKEPDVFLFDEPLSNLDAALRVQTRLEIAKLHHDIGRASMIYVTHDQVEAMTLADKIVLLRAGAAVQTEGSVAQFGTPMELYHRPQNLFVAEFIGSPKMNVMPGRLTSAEADHAVVEVHGEPVTVAVDARGTAAGASVTVGIRPEHLQLGDAGEGYKLHSRLRHVERLGDESLLYLEVSPGTPLVTLRLEGDAKQAADAEVTMGLPPGQCHLFDAAGKAFPRTVPLPS
jgi:multiple sugar transport system ATP-binding protein